MKPNGNGLEAQKSKGPTLLRLPRYASGKKKKKTTKKKTLPRQETQETRARPLGLEDPLEEGTAIHSSIRAWRTSWTKESGGL